MIQKIFGRLLLPALITLALLAARAEAVPQSDQGYPFDLAKADFRRELQEKFQYEPPEPPVPVDEAGAGRSADARYFALFPEYDRAYSDDARALARVLSARLIGDAASLSHEQFVLRLAEIAALARNAHTSVNENAFKKNTPRVPLRLYQFADGLHVVTAPPAYANLLGARIERIDGVAVEDVHRLLRRYHGGTDARRRAILVPFLESPALLRAAGFAGHSNAILLEGTLLIGKPFEQLIAAEIRGTSAPVSSTARILLPRKSTSTNVGLHSPGINVPVSLTDPSSLFISRPLPGNGLYVRLDYNGDSDEQPIGEFLEAVLASIRRDKPHYVTIDLRQNGGGDYTKTYGFAKELPAVSGSAQIYVLTSPFTFSAAITTVAALKTFGGDRVRIVGDVVGDRLDFWAEGSTFHLPNSFVDVHFSTGRHIYDGPCHDWDSCFWLNRQYPVYVRSLSPDIDAPWTFDAYRNLKDPALEAILAQQLEVSDPSAER